MLKARILLLFLPLFEILFSSLIADEFLAYAKSFVAHYESNITGKFTHEYHPYLLDKTTDSLDALEAALTTAGMHSSGRIMLMGYEEQGIPRYYTDHTVEQFTDEVSAKTTAGWSLKMFNRFGVLTGFLLKDAAFYSAYLLKKYQTPAFVTHIDADQIEIFDGCGTLFQEHAFGDAYQPLMQYYKEIERIFLANRVDLLPDRLMSFWKLLYDFEIKITGKQHVVGTQDILFSIAYMRYLQRSKVPLQQIYTGADITYPIEELAIQGSQATRHAQAFVRTFVPKLQPRENKNTAYIFCSFVDGVGKSTMLGNIQNWMKHGAHVEHYTHVDNSSSQLATVFQFSDKVWIADLPAQVSHFTYKPDGQVFVVVGATDKGAQERAALHSYVRAQRQSLHEQFDARVTRIAEQVQLNGIMSVYASDNAQDAFIANLFLLRKQQENRYISFEFNDEIYLYNRDDLSDIRLLVSLANAPSHGLKNSSPEQMLFTRGVRFPLAYDRFLDDLITQLRGQGIEEVVMVDFLSMYSRSSRENIRVNYIIQQLALLYSDFEVATSFYQNYVHNAQLLAVLDSSTKKEAYMKSLLYETVVRSALYLLLLKHADCSIEGVPVGAITTMVKEMIASLSRTELRTINTLVEKKIASEYENLLRAYGSTREYVLTQQFDARDLVAFSKKMIKTFTKTCRNERVNALWHLFDDATCLKVSSIQAGKYSKQQCARLDNDCLVHILGRIDCNCKDRSVLTALLKEARAMWYAALSNLLYSSQEGSDEQIEMVEQFAVLPLVALYDDEGSICLVTPQLEEITKEYAMPEYRLFLGEDPAGDASTWGVFQDQLYLTDWSCVRHTNQGVFALCHEIQTKGDKSVYYSDKSYTSKIWQAHADEIGDGRVLPTQQLLEYLLRDKDGLLAHKQRIAHEAEQNGVCPADVTPPRNMERDEWGFIKQDTKPRLYVLPDHSRFGAKLFVRMIATLEMILKDPEADIALRRGHEEDFAAQIELMQELTLPSCYGLYVPGGLFNAEKPKPTLSWKYFDSRDK